MSQLVRRRPHATAVTDPQSDESLPALLLQMPGEPQFHLWHGQKCHYRRVGSGPPVILVHDSDVGGSSAEWRRVVEHLSVTFTVFAVDLPGFGLSDVEPSRYTAEHCIQFLRSFQTELVGQCAYAVGSGRGAAYLIHLAARWPQSLSRLVLACPTGLTSLRSPVAPGLAFGLLRLPGIQHLVLDSATGYQAILEHLKREVYAEDLMAGAQEADARFWVSHRPGADYLECSRLAGLLNVGIRDSVRKLTQETLLIWGRHTDKPPLSDAEIFRELQPGTHLVVFEKSGPHPHVEEPARFCERVSDFLQAAALTAAA